MTPGEVRQTQLNTLRLQLAESMQFAGQTEQETIAACLGICLHTLADDSPEGCELVLHELVAEYARYVGYRHRKETPHREPGSTPATRPFYPQRRDPRA